MATVTKVAAKDREKALAKAEASGARTLAGGLNVPEGTHKLQVAAKNAFGILNVTSASSGEWALPIVSGTLSIEGAEEIEFELSDKAGAKTLVIPNQFYLEMAEGAEYDVTFETRKGRKVVTNVVPAE